MRFVIDDPILQPAFGLGIYLPRLRGAAQAGIEKIGDHFKKAGINSCHKAQFSFRQAVSFLTANILQRLSGIGAKTDIGKQTDQ